MPDGDSARPGGTLGARHRNRPVTTSEDIMKLHPFPAAALSTAGLLALALVGTGAGAAQASGGGGATVRTAGHCTGSTVWKLKAKTDDGRLQTEFEVDSNRVGQTWSVAINDNGVRAFTGTRRTTAPSGSFSVEPRIVNRAGADRITAVASNSRTGERCVGSLRFP
jgi:hypothetical protein